MWTIFIGLVCIEFIIVSCHPSVQILLHAALKYDGLNYLEIVEIRLNN